MPQNTPIPHPGRNPIEPHRHGVSRWRLRLVAVLAYLRRRLFGSGAQDAAPHDPPARVRSLAEWRRLAGACWIDEGNLRVALLRARLRADGRTESSVRRSLRRVVGQAKRLLDELRDAQRRGDIDRSASRPPEALLRSVILAWETPPDALLDGQLVDRHRMPVLVDAGDVLPIDALDPCGPDRSRR